MDNKTRQELVDEILNLRFDHPLDPEIQAAQRKINYVKENNPQVDILVHPRCQEILAGNERASKKLGDMNDLFLSEYPTYILPEKEELHHPAYLARYFDIPAWLVKQFGDVVDFYSLYLAAAKEWFPYRTDSDLEGAFCFKFVSLGLVSELGEDEAMQPIWEDFNKWWYGREPQG